MEPASSFQVRICFWLFLEMMMVKWFWESKRGDLLCPVALFLQSDAAVRECGAPLQQQVSL